MGNGGLLLLGVAMILGGFGLAYGGFVTAFRKPGRAMLMLMGAVVLLGAAFGLLHLIHRPGF